MKIIFMDIDGVLVNKWSKSQPIARWYDNSIYPFSPQAVKHVNYIIEQTGAQMILSSEWRFRYNPETIEQIFRFNKVKQIPEKIPHNFLGEFRDRDNMYELKRSKEIEVYVKENKIKDFVILDDWEVYCFPERLVRTVRDEGLKEKHVPRVLEILETK